MSWGVAVLGTVMALFFFFLSPYSTFVSNYSGPDRKKSCLIIAIKYNPFFCENPITVQRTLFFHYYMLHM